MPDALRMSVWLAAGLVFYALAVFLGVNYPAAQTVCYKIGHVTTLSWVGYWVSRQLLGRISTQSAPVDRLSRAVLVAGIVLAGSMGL